MFVITSETIKRARITQILIIVNIFCYILLNLILGYDYVFLFAQDNSAVLNGEIWRLFTSIFIHLDILHIFSNCLGLFIFGMTIENLFSKGQYLTTYFVSGMLGSIFSLIITPNTIGLGASGAIYGLMGASFIILSQEDQRVFLYGVLYIVISLTNSFTTPGIGSWAHLFGLLGGILFGYLYIKKEKQGYRTQSDREYY